jgi:hypothetical protein
LRLLCDVLLVFRVLGHAAFTPATSFSMGNRRKLSLPYAQVKRRRRRTVQHSSNVREEM